MQLNFKCEHFLKIPWKFFSNLLAIYNGIYIMSSGLEKIAGGKLEKS